MTMMIGNVWGNTNTTDIVIQARPEHTNVGELVVVAMKHNNQEMQVWARVFRMERFNAFLNSGAIRTIAGENEEIINTVLPMRGDEIVAHAKVLGVGTKLKPLKYPINPGAKVIKPTVEQVKKVLTGDKSKNKAPLHLGHLVGRESGEDAVSIDINGDKVVGRHMAILAQTGGGKTVASKQIIYELFKKNYPVIIFDIHGDYLSFSEEKNLKKLGKTKDDIKIYYPTIKFDEQLADDIVDMVNEVRSTPLTDNQAPILYGLIETYPWKEGEYIGWQTLIDYLIDEIRNADDPKELAKRFQCTQAGVRPLRSGLNAVRDHLNQMDYSSNALRKSPSLGKRFNFEEMPPLNQLEDYVKPGQLTIFYLGGYDDLAISSTAARILSHLFQQRSTLQNTIPPFFAVIEEAHNLIPASRERTGRKVPSLAVMKKVITEGRKFGTGLLLVTQRPSRIDDNLLSQCNTHLILKLTNPKDQKQVESMVENISESDLAQLPALAPGEGIISGQAVEFTNMVKIEFNPDLEADYFKENFFDEVKNFKAPKRASKFKSEDDIE